MADSSKRPAGIGWSAAYFVVSALSDSPTAIIFLLISFSSDGESFTYMITMLVLVFPVWDTICCYGLLTLRRWAPKSSSINIIFSILVGAIVQFSISNAFGLASNASGWASLVLKIGFGFLIIRYLGKPEIITKYHKIRF